ncbi:unnamed protein product [Ixodes pacificus]
MNSFDDCVHLEPTCIYDIVTQNENGRASFLADGEWSKLRSAASLKKQIVPKVHPCHQTKEELHFCMTVCRNVKMLILVFTRSVSFSWSESSSKVNKIIASSKQGTLKVFPSRLLFMTACNQLPRNYFTSVSFCV